MNVVNENFDKKMIDDARWEYDDHKVSIIKKVDKGDGKFSIHSTLYNSYMKNTVTLNVNLQSCKVIGFCDCEQCSKKGTCKHMIMTLFSFLEKKIEKTDDLKIFKDIYAKNNELDLIHMTLRVKSLFDNEHTIGLSSNIYGYTSYSVKSITKMINDIESNNKIILGKKFESKSYMLDNLSSYFFESVKSLTYKMITQNRDIDKNFISNSELSYLLQSKLNQEIIINESVYLVRNSLDDVRIRIEKKDQLSLIVQNLEKYDFLSDDIVINEIDKIIYTITENQKKKVAFLKEIEKSDNVLKIVDEDSFLNDILPNIYDDFEVKFSNNLDYKVVDEKLNPEIFCKLLNRKIHLSVKYMYGQYDALGINKGILIKRNKTREKHITDIISNQGYVYDPNLGEFIIEASRMQYNFLTNNLFVLRQECDVFLDERLQNAIINFDSSNVSVSINNSSETDFFEFDYDLNGLDKKEVDKIIDSYKLKVDFVQLKDGSFLKLNDSHFLDQLKFIQQIVGEKSHKMNTHRIPKYRSYLVKKQASKLFENITTTVEFEDYITSITLIDNIQNDLLLNENYILRDYQKYGVSWLTQLYKASLGALLADEMGLGKTIQVISFLEINKISNVLIVVPKALLYNWKMEFAKYSPDTKCLVVDGTFNKREQMLKNKKNDEVVLISYSSLVKDYETINSLDIDCLVIDEAQYIKNSQTKTARVVKKIESKFFIALTGTPIENSLLELWSIFDFIIPGYLKDKSSFKEQFIDGQMDIKSLIAPFVLRRVKKDVLKELPDKIVSDVYVKMQEQQAVLYMDLVKQAKKLELEKMGHIQILSYITKLRQAAIDPGFIYENYLEDSGKMNLFDEIVDEIILSDEKVVVFSQFTTILKKLNSRLDKKNCKCYYLDGSTRPKERLKSVERFNKNNIPVFLVSLKAGGVGLNLTSASNVIIFDPWWNPAVEAQAIDRTHRIGQKKIVKVYRFISKDTIEEKIMKLSDKKKQVADDVLQNDTQFISSLSTDDLRGLLT